MIIGTAGHVDHGKSALVEALTGRSMDPLPDERRRGITLDLHVAPLTLNDGTIAGIVDVPGHEDLVRTMIAGAAGIDLALLVVAANEGIMPQTREHLVVLEELGIARGIPVVTKADLVDTEWLALVLDELKGWLGSSRIDFSPPLVVSARTRQGVQDLRAAIESCSRGQQLPVDDDLSRMPVDRVLSIPGAGTVLTGTVSAGRFRPGDPIQLLPSRAEGRIRSVERHGSSVEAVRRGERAAIAVAGLEAGAVHRGEVVVEPDQGWDSTEALDAAIHLTSESPLTLTRGLRLRFCLGTAEVLGRIQTVGAIRTGDGAVARILLESPLVAQGGDRFVVRSYSPVRVIGGGVVLDARPPRSRKTALDAIPGSSPEARLALVASRHPAGVPVREARLRAGVPLGDVPVLAARIGLLVDAGVLLLPAAVADAGAEAVRRVREYHASHGANAGMPMETLRAALRDRGQAGVLALERLWADGSLVAAGGVVALPGFVPEGTADPAQRDRLLEAVRQGGLAGETVAELERRTGIRNAAAALREAAEEGLVVAVERDRYLSRGSIDQFEHQLARIAHRGLITPAAVREMTGLSRKHLIPLLEWADRAGLTIRSADGRVAGPRLRHDQGA
jgi:selenocysteine-specific elongation factor